MAHYLGAPPARHRTYNTEMPIPARLLLALLAAASSYPSVRMADGKHWTTKNLAVNITPSYCYADSNDNCQHYGRLYTWTSARRACESLGDGWRLPADEDWRSLAKQYGGISEDSTDRGAASYRKLTPAGGAKFDAVLGGGRAEDGQYARLEAHGFYWSATENDAGHAYFYNFAKGSQGFHRQSGGNKDQAFSVRCVRD